MRALNRFLAHRASLLRALDAIQEGVSISWPTITPSESWPRFMYILGETFLKRSSRLSGRPHRELRVGVGPRVLHIEREVRGAVPRVRGLIRQGYSEALQARHLHDLVDLIL